MDQIQTFTAEEAQPHAGASPAPAKRSCGTAGFSKNLAELARGAIPRELAGRPKSGFRMNPPCAIPKRFAPWTPWRIPPAPETQGIWATRGTRPRIRRDRRFTWAKPAKGSDKRSLLEWPAEGSTPSELVENCPARGTGLVMPPVSIAATSPNLAPRLGPKTWPQEMNGNFIRRCRKSQVQSFTPKAEAAHAALGQDHIEPRLDHAGQIHPAPAPHAINGTVWSFVNQLCSCCGVSRGFGPAARARPDQMESFDR
jgi:hypothetical protein